MAVTVGELACWAGVSITWSRDGFDEYYKSPSIICRHLISPYALFWGGIREMIGDGLNKADPNEPITA